MPDTVLTLTVIVGLIALGSLLVSPRARTASSFYRGHDSKGPPARCPGADLLTGPPWIFARSIMNAAILGYFYGIGGALA